jgi:hypothetical protein
MKVGEAGAGAAAGNGRSGAGIRGLEGQCDDQAERDERDCVGEEKHSIGAGLMDGAPP